MAGVRSIRGSSRPGGLYLHPLPAAATALLLLNDHYLKGRIGGSATGKLSDVAGLLMAPMAALAVAELVLAARHRPWVTTSRRLVVTVLLVGVAFTAVKLNGTAGAVYGDALGLVRWPFLAMGAAVAGHPVAGPARVVVLRDASDLLALPALVVAWFYGARWAVRPMPAASPSRPCT